MTPETGRCSGPVTIRAVAIGLVSSVVMNLLMGYNDGYLRNTPFTGNHFPVVPIAFLGALVLVVNASMRRWMRLEGLRPGELVLIWGMLGVAGGIGSAGLMRYFPSWVVSPAYYAGERPEYVETILKYIPDWMLVSHDPDDTAIRGYMEGLTRGVAIPWGNWVAPMIAWFSFVLLLYCVTFALSSMFYRQWAEHERLVFPIVHLPVELSRMAPAGKAFNDFLRNPVMWVGFAIPAVIRSLNELHEHFALIPSIPLSWVTWGFFPDRPWSEFHLELATVYFMVVGLTFLLTLEVAFSFWFFFVLYRLSYVFVAWIGAAGAGFWENWQYRSTVFPIAGVQVVLALFLFWSARKYLFAWLKRARAGKRDPALDPFAPRVALVLITGGLAGMIFWLLIAGVQWWVAVAAILIFVVGVLVTSRIVAESGLLFVNNNVVPYDVVTGILPSSWLSGMTVNALLMQKAVVMADARELMLPYLLNGARAVHRVAPDPNPARQGSSLGKVFIVFAITAAVAIGAASYGRIMTGYKYGGINLDPWSNIWGPDSYLAETHRQMSLEADYEWLKVGDVPVVPANAAQVGVGAVLAAALLWLRASFLWWPLHPFGLALCAAWSTGVIWFSIFLGWLAKALVMTFGGAAAYRKVLPFFLGMVLGEALIAGLWLGVSLALGQPARPILPG